MFQFSKACKVIRVLNATAAGSTDITTAAAVDTKGYEGVAFLGAFGALTATQVTSMKAQQSSDNGVADGFSDLAGTKLGPLADADGNKLLLLDVFRPQKRYVKPIINRATANAVVDGVFAILYGAREEPITSDSTVKETELHVSPAEGTA